MIICHKFDIRGLSATVNPGSSRNSSRPAICHSCAKSATRRTSGARNSCATIPRGETLWCLQASSLYTACRLPPPSVAFDDGRSIPIHKPDNPISAIGGSCRARKYSAVSARHAAQTYAGVEIDLGSASPKQCYLKNIPKVHIRAS